MNITISVNKIITLRISAKANFKFEILLPTEFKNTAGIFVPGTNPNSIFGKEPFITPVLAVKFQI
jgi:hypothetical protein